MASMSRRFSVDSVQEPQLPFERALSGDDYTSFLVDEDGNAYEPYALAWRFLGMYIDCDMYSYDDDSNWDGDEFNRRRAVEDSFIRQLSGSNDGDDCSRKVLWAAYRNPRYRGHSIGEYQFYDWRTETWDKSACQGRRCTKMDCHEPHSRWKLIGVYKETDGLYDWAEQLFKHQGYCVWDGDKEQESGDSGESGESGEEEEEDERYDTMQNMLEDWKSGCSKLYLSDSNGNTLYMDTKPLPDGNFTYDVYQDESCTQISSIGLYQYIVKFYTYYYYNSEKGQAYAAEKMAGFEQWNENMNDFKVCQPCRAYNKVATYEDNDRRDRHLNEDEDGAGAEEQYGFNCYDDAGYRNCNQCYKFETHTDMEEASVQDLERATTQGTIVGIRVNGVWYGSGGYYKKSFIENFGIPILALLAALALTTVILICRKRHKKALDMLSEKIERKRKRLFPRDLREALYEDSDTDNDDDATADTKLQELEKQLEQKNRMLQERESSLLKLRGALENAHSQTGVVEVVVDDSRAEQQEKEIENKNRVLRERESSLLRIRSALANARCARPGTTIDLVDDDSLESLPIPDDSLESLPIPEDLPDELPRHPSLEGPKFRAFGP